MRAFEAEDKHITFCRGATKQSHRISKVKDFLFKVSKWLCGKRNREKNEKLIFVMSHIYE